MTTAAMTSDEVVAAFIFCSLGSDYSLKLALFLHERFYAVGDILLEIIIEEAVVVEMVALWAEEG